MEIVSQNVAPGKYLNRYLLAVTVILLLASFLRLLFIGDHGLWLDELFSLKFATSNLQELLRKVAAIDNHPPTYYILLHYWILLFGDSEVSLRMPSVIFSVLSVLFTCKVGRILFNTRVAMIAGLLLALSSFSIYYAQEVRMYSLLAFASVLSVYFLLRYLENRTTGSLIKYVLSATLLVYTHLYGLFILFAENLYFLTIIFAGSNRNAVAGLKRWVWAQLVILLLSLPWLVALANRVLNIGEEGFWVSIPTWNSLAKTLAKFSGTSAGLPVWIMLLLAGILAGLVFKSVPRRAVPDGTPCTNQYRSVLLLSLLLVIPVVVPYLISQFMTPIYIIRSTIVAQPAFILLVARGISCLPWRAARYTALAVILGLSVKSLALDGYVHRGDARIRQLVEYIATHSGNGDVVVICGDDHLNRPFEYYAQKQPNPFTVINLLKPGDIKTLAAPLAVNQLWFVRRTDRAEWCTRVSPTLSDRFAQTGETETTFRNLELRTYAKMR